MGDFTFASVAFHCYCDENYRRSLKNRSKQIVFIANDDCHEYQKDSTRGLDMPGGPAIFYAGIEVDLRSFEDLPHGACYTLLWNGSLEARPDHIIEQFGANRGETCMVVDERSIPIVTQQQIRSLNPEPRLSLIHISEPTRPY